MHQNAAAGWGITLLSAVVGAWSCFRLAAPGRGGAPGPHGGCGGPLSGRSGTCASSVSRLSYLAHAVMGAGMAALMCPAGDPVPARAWAVVFGLLALVLVAARHPRVFHHASSSAVMVYLITAAPARASTAAGATMAGMSMGGAPEPAAVGLCGDYLWGLVLYLGWRLVRVMGAGDDVRLAYGCELVLAVGMGLMAVPGA